MLILNGLVGCASGDAGGTARTRDDSPDPQTASPRVESLTRLLPEHVGGLVRLNAAEDRWPNPADRHAIGGYAWSAAPSQKAARLSCAARPDDLESIGYDKGAKGIRLGQRFACMYREDRHATTFEEGAAVIWGDCALQFEPGGTRGHSQNELREVATQIAVYVASKR